MTLAMLGDVDQQSNQSHGQHLPADVADGRKILRADGTDEGVESVERGINARQQFVCAPVALSLQDGKLAVGKLPAFRVSAEAIRAAGQMFQMKSDRAHRRRAAGIFPNLLTGAEQMIADGI
jgi:hypothetical protein